MLSNYMYSILSLSLFFDLALSAPAPAASPASHSSAIHDIYQFPNKGTWIENLAVRANGQIMITRLDTPVVQQVNPFTPGQEPTTIYTFPAALGTYGITELEPDVFVVTTGNFSLTSFQNQPGAFSVWKVDMRRYHGPGTAKVSKICDLPEVIFLNGATTLDPIKGTVLIADSQGGSVVRVDTYTGTHTVVQKDTTMAPIPTAHLPLGINGLHVRDGYLYFTSSNQELFVRVPINPDGTASGAYETLVTNTVGQFDDFTFDVFGDSFNCQGPSNTLAKITIKGTVGTEQEVAGNATSTAIAGNTSAKFGRTIFDLKTLYVTTNGGLTEGAPIAQGAKIAAVDVPVFGG